METPCVQPLEPRLLFAGEKILFIRGGSGTGGFYDGGTLAPRVEELADINNVSTASGNHGWGELANLLRADGYSPTQVIEGSASSNTPIDLAAANLSQYALVV